MIILEHRRHSMRDPPYQHLNQKGVNLARQIGNSLGPFNLVITSTVLRAIETAVAMGFAINLSLKELNSIEQGVEEEVVWNAGFAKFNEAFNEEGITRGWIERLGELMKEILKNVPKNGAALIISHGGIVEGCTIGCLPGYDFSTWNYSVNYCEGVRLSFNGKEFVSVEFLSID